MHGTSNKFPKSLEEKVHVNSRQFSLTIWTFETNLSSNRDPTPLSIYWAQQVDFSQSNSEIRISIPIANKDAKVQRIKQLAKVTEQKWSFYLLI